MGNYSYFFMPFVNERVKSYETYLDVRKIPLYNRVSPTGRVIPPSQEKGVGAISSTSTTDKTSNLTSTNHTSSTTNQTEQLPDNTYSTTSVFQSQKTQSTDNKPKRIFTVEVSDSYRFWTQNLYYPGGIFDLYIY